MCSSHPLILFFANTQAAQEGAAEWCFVLLWQRLMQYGSDVNFIKKDIKKKTKQEHCGTLAAINAHLLPVVANACTIETFVSTG